MSKIIYPTWNSLDNSPPRLVRWTFSPGDGHAWLDLGKEHLAGLFGGFPPLLVRLRTLLGDDNSLTLFSLAGLVAELLEKPALIWREQSLLFCFLALGSSQDATAFSWNLFPPTIQISIKLLQLMVSNSQKLYYYYYYCCHFLFNQLLTNVHRRSWDI